MALGSLFDRLPRGLFGRSLHVWGTGSIEARVSRRCKHHVHALRGPRTASLQRSSTSLDPAAHPALQPPVYGDPGLLAELLLPSSHRRRPTIALGLIPHYKDAALPAVQQILDHFPAAKVIDVFNTPQRVVEQIASCHHVLSSSLHGLIVADAVGVPSRWLKLSDGVRGGGWKFRDYYESFDDPLPPSIQQSLTLETLLGSRLESLFADWVAPRLDAQKERLVNAFPDL